MIETDEVVRQSNPCQKCGARFELRYDKRTCKAAQFWPDGCGPETDCFKALMPPSDFATETQKTPTD